MMYKTCIFDLDGTLTDTLDSLTFSVNETMRRMGLSGITADQCRQFVGNGSRVLMEKALQASGEQGNARVEEAMEIYGHVFHENCLYRVKPYAGICELLEALRKRKIRLAVLSNKPDVQAVRVVEQIFGKDCFDWIQGQKDGVPRKPNPAAAVFIAGKLGAEIDETVYIGDSEVDIETGRAAKMKTIGVSWGFRSTECLKRAGAEYIVHRPEEITGLILQWETHSDEKGR